MVSFDSQRQKPAGGLLMKERWGGGSNLGQTFALTVTFFNPSSMCWKVCVYILWRAKEKKRESFAKHKLKQNFLFFNEWMKSHLSQRKFWVQESKNTFLSERGEASHQIRNLTNFTRRVAMWWPDFTPTFTSVSAKLLSLLHTCCCCHVNELHIFSRSAPLEWKGKYLHYAGGPECTRRPAIPLTRVCVQNNTVLTLISL